MTVAALLAGIAIFLTVWNYHLPKPRTTLALSGAFAWLLFSLQSYSLHTVAWDIYFGMFWFGIACTLAFAIEGVAMTIGAPDTKEGDFRVPDEGEPGYHRPPNKIEQMRNKIRQRNGLKKMDGRGGW